MNPYDTLADDVRDFVHRLEWSIRNMKILRGEPGGLGPYGCIESIELAIHDFKTEERPDLFTEER